MLKIEEAFEEYFKPFNASATAEYKFVSLLLAYRAGANAMAEILSSHSAPTSRVERLCIELLRVLGPNHVWTIEQVANSAITYDRLLSEHEKLHP